MRRHLEYIFCAFVIMSITIVPNVGRAGHQLMELKLVSPGAKQAGRSQQDGVVTRKYQIRDGVLPTTQWPLILRLATKDAVGFAEEFFSGESREALVLLDPDGCLVLTSLIDDIFDLGKTEFDVLCAGLPEDETYIEVQTEKFDTFELVDNSNTGNNKIQEMLIDDDCTDSPESRNVACLLMDNGKLQTVGPKTGEAASDGYGYGTDDDAASMVILLDVGGARVFDADTFDLVPGVLRNMAGLINTVSTELLTGVGTTAVTMTTHTLAGYAEPIALFDFSLSDPQFDGFSALRRVDSGPLIPFNFDSEFPTDNNSSAEFNPFYDEMLATYYPVDVTLRAVAVAGEAPPAVSDVNMDGIVSAADLMASGDYEVVSNEIEVTLRLTFDNLLVDSEDPKCPPRTFIFRDLDGDGMSGAPEKCSGTSSSTRSRRIPQ